MRLDKWLWCARFYKTRSLAAKAIKEGKIKINELKVKPARLIQISEKLVINQKPFRYEITVENMAKSRVSASEASHLFHESEESILKRESVASQLKLAASSQGHVNGRPNKQQRRKIIRFTRRVD